MSDTVGILRDVTGLMSVEWDVIGYPKYQETLSRYFLFGDAQWCLQIIKEPRKNAHQTVRFFSLYLLIGDSKTEKHTAEFTLGVKKRDGSVFKFSKHQCEFIKSSGWGWRKFVKHAHLLDEEDDLLPNNTLRVFCEARIVGYINSVDAASQTEPQEGSETLIQNLTEFYKKKEGADVTFKLKDKQFQADRSILSIRSPVFAAMFEQAMIEEKSYVVDIDDCDPNSFEDFLLYLYTGRMDRVSSNNIFALYKIADKYGIKDLKTQCAAYMACDLSVVYICDTLLIASEHYEPELLEKATEFFIRNAKEIFLTAKWRSFLKDHSSFCSTLLIKMVRSKCADYS